MSHSILAATIGCSLRPSYHAVLLSERFVAFFFLSVSFRSPRYFATERELQTNPLCQAERVYLSVLIWNNEDLLRSRWIPDLLDMVRVLGIDNVFNSVYDSGS